MVAYLLAILPEECEAGYYLMQPKDETGGFSRDCFAATVQAIEGVCQQHSITAVLGVDLGGDAAIEKPHKEGGPFIPERDRLNLLATRVAAKKRKLSAPDCLLTAVGPGVDAAAVAPQYAERREATARVLELGEDVRPR
eukprot:1097669-Prymnesium_polylepis.1